MSGAMSRRPMRATGAMLALAACVAGAAGLAGQASAERPASRAADATVGNFNFGQMQSTTIGATGCGTNAAGEPSLHVSRANNVFLGSELGVGGGSQLWRGLGAVGGTGASGCGLEYRGQPNAVTPGTGLSGGDIDIAVAPERTRAARTTSTWPASTSPRSTSPSRRTTAPRSPRCRSRAACRSMTASGSPPSAPRPRCVTYHDIATNNIDVLRRDTATSPYTQISQVIPPTDYKAMNNELGNIVIDHNNRPAAPGAFYAYQAFVAPSSSAGTHNNEAWLGVSSDGGHTWADKAIACSTERTSTDLNHNFPNVSVDPAGNLWYAWSDDHKISTAKSADHGTTWTCSRPVSTTSAQAIFPWLAATSKGVDLVYYGAPTTTNQTWYVEFAQNLSGAPTGWGAPQQLMSVHTGAVCESGINCTTGRQLFDDFAVDTDSNGWAHIAYSHDSPALGGAGTYTGYAVQTKGTPVGHNN